MNKKIVFSLAVLSAFSYVSGVYIDDDITCKDNKNSNFNQCAKVRWQFKLGNPNIQDHISVFDSCLKAYDPNTGDERGRYSFNKCTRLGKAHDNFYVQCVNKRGVPLAERSEDFHRVNLLSDKFKAKYDALRVCSIQHYDARKYDICKYFESGNQDLCKTNKGPFVKLYQDLVEKTLKNNPSDYCRDILTQELDDVKLYREKGIKRSIVEYPVYFPYSLPDAIQIRKNNIQNFEVEAKFNVKTQKKIIQDYYKEFVTDTTGRIEVESNAAKTYTRTLIYFLEQADVDWQVENFAKYIVGNDAVHDWSKGLGWLDWGSANGKVVDSDNNKIVFINGKNFEGAQGAGNVYEHFLNYRSKYLDNNEELRNKIYEYLFLKNSRVRPITSNYFRDYPENYREGGNLGGPSKCYNYDLQQFKSEYSRASYFDYQNLNDFVFNSGAPEFQPKKYTFSIHKSFDNTKGIFEEGKNTKFSINVRPSFDNTSPFYDNNPTGNEGGIYNSIKLKFYADADSLFITDIANQDNRNLSKPLKVNDLDNVYIALKNHGDSIPVRNAGTKYYLSQFTMSKRQISDSDGAVDGKLINIENTDPIELQIQEGINGLGLKFDQNAFYKLVGISKKEIEDGKTYEITFKIKTIIDDNGIYKRPLFEEDSERIVSGKQEGEFGIIVGKGQMPKVNFGTAYNPKDSDKVIKDNKKSPDTQIAGKIYTRTNNQDIYLGFNIPTKAYNEQFVRFLNNDGKDLDVVAYDEYKQLNTKNGKCDGYYPTTNPLVIKLKNKLSVGQDYRLRYEIAEYDGVTEECIPLGDNTSNSFSIRPESIEYKVNSLEKFNKNAGKVDSNYTDNNVTFTSNKDDRFGIGVAELRVSDSKAKELKFYLEDENSNQLKVPSKNPYFANFSSNGEFKIKTVFPMVTDAKIVFAENKFTINDLKEELCTNNDEALDIASANKIDKNGKINCQTPGNELQVNFIANEELGFAYNEKLGLKRDKLNILAFSDDDNDQLLFPVQLQNKVNDGRMDKYFYKKYTSDTASVTYEFNTVNIGKADFDKRIIGTEVVVDKDPKSKSPTISINPINNTSFEVSGLNEGFDTKLATLNKDEKLSGYDESLFDASEFGKVKLSLRYPKKTNSIFNQLPKFVITDKSKASFNINGIVMERTLDKNYDVAFTALKFKDISCKTNTGCFKDSIEKNKVSFVYFDEANKEQKIKTNDNKKSSKVVYNGDLTDLVASVNFVTDYGTKITTLDYEFDNKYKKQTYVKDSVKVVPTKGNSYLDANISFTIEVDLRK